MGRAFGIGCTFLKMAELCRVSQHTRSTVLMRSLFLYCINETRRAGSIHTRLLSQTSNMGVESIHLPRNNTDDFFIEYAKNGGWWMPTL
jgi:hypothetical protein